MFVYFSKVQARTAFAMYLVRVQQRLMADSNSLTQDDVDGLNEQMVSIVSSPEHEVSYCGQWVVRRPSTFDVYTLETTFVIRF